MRSAEKILDELAGIGRMRSSLQFDTQVAERELGEVFDEAKEHPDIAMSDAAKVAGVDRSLAYKLIRKSGRSDN